MRLRELGVAPSAFYNRAYRSLVQWQTREEQKAPSYPFSLMIGILVRSIFHQGILWSHRRQYWKFILHILTRWHCKHAKRPLPSGFVQTGFWEVGGAAYPDHSNA